MRPIQMSAEIPEIFYMAFLGWVPGYYIELDQSVSYLIPVYSLQVSHSIPHNFRKLNYIFK